MEEAEKVRITNKEIFSLGWWALRFWWKHDWSSFVMYLSSEIYDGISGVLSSYITGLLISQLIIVAQTGGNLFNAIWWVLCLYGANIFVGSLLSQVDRMATNQRNTRIGNALEMLYAQKFRELTLGDVDGRDFANKFELAKDAKKTLSSRLQNFTNLVKYPIIVILVSTPLILQGYWYIVLLTSIFAMPVAFTNAGTTKKKVQYKNSNVEYLRAATETAAYFQNSSDANKETKVHGGHQLMIKKGTERIITYAEKMFSFEREWFWQRSFINISDTLVNLAVLYSYIIKIGSDIRKIAGVLPYSSMVGRVRMSVLNFFQQYTQIAESVEEVMRVKEFLEYEPTNLFAKNGALMVDEAPAIDVNNVKFIYPNTEREILKGITIDINPGEKIAIVGENGVGKTTLLKLLMGMYKQTEGEILVNSKPLFSYTAESYYRNLGVLFQAFPTYPALTVRDNVVVGRYADKIDDAKVTEALKLADAWNFVEKYPNQLEQVLSHRYKNGIQPSTGQWQKLAIARLFYRDPKLVFFDEPTASIDAESEYKIFNEIFSFFKNKTVIIVSHRFSTVRNADKIIVLKEGLIAEQGTHDQLLALKGVYASAYQKQAEGYKD